MNRLRQIKTRRIQKVVLEKYISAPEVLNDISTKHKEMTFGEILDYLSHQDMNGKILDVGERNPLIGMIEKAFAVKADSTSGDLDFLMIAPSNQYDLIICSHVIEHLINPLICLVNMRKLLSENGKIFIAYPERPFKRQGHYHEIPFRDMEVALAKAKLRIVDHVIHNHKNFGIITGLRPLIRRIIEAFINKHHLVLLEKQ